ncbi:MAG: cation diffusion facilitator family transporter [Ruminococcus sp.]|jgi:cation diffusion facilitator family transporter|nr:cation diffusion facilitator family transporter [Ruminococcus sp.]
MIKLLEKIFIKKDSANRRMKYGMLGGFVGIVCNLLLFGVKFAVGTLTGSIAVISDSFNNLSDMGSSIVVIIGAKTAALRPDREHPFGHGRIEYIASLIISIIIILVGVELIQTSAERIINPVDTDFSWVMMIILVFAACLKLWMFAAFGYLSKTINSSVLRAMSKDSFNDVLSSLAVVAAVITDHFIAFNADGIIGVAVAIYIIISGFSMAKETVDLLLGSPPDPETCKKIRGIILSGSEVVGVHDLMVHDYGPGRIFASAHAEVSSERDPVIVHECIDALEREVMEECDVRLVLHTDPISVNDERVNSLKSMTADLVAALNPTYTIHDFRITDGENNINLIFDIAVRDKPNERDKEELAETTKRMLRAIDPRYNCVITVDDEYI